MKKLVAVFGPAACIEGDALYDDARKLGRLLAEANFPVVTGGYQGVMEAASRGAREAGGTAIGVTAEVYYARGREANPYLTREIKVKSANDRTMEMLDLADAYIAIGNSTGTLAEVALAWDYMVKRFLPEKPLILIGEDWERFGRAVQPFSHVQQQLSLLRFSPSAESAVAELERILGKQLNLPDLSVLKG